MATGVDAADLGNLINKALVDRVGMADLIVKAAVKEYLDEQNVASDFYDSLDEEVKELLDRAAKRAEENDRKTVQSRDL